MKKIKWNGMMAFEAALTALTLLFLLLPVLQMICTAFMKNAFRGFKAGFTTDWIEKVLTLYGDTIIRSLGIAVGALVICVLIGVPAAWVLVREEKKRWAALIEEALILPLSMPGLAVGLGLSVKPRLLGRAEKPVRGGDALPRQPLPLARGELADG